MTADLREIVQRVGGTIYAGGRSAVVPGPGHSRRDRSLSLTVGDDGRVVYFNHAAKGHDYREITAHLGIEARSGSSARDGRERLRLAAQRQEAERKRQAEDRALVRFVWAGTVPIEATAAESYLWRRRLILEAVPAVRFHPSAPRSKRQGCGPCGAMVGLVTEPDGSPLGLHLTYLTPDGSKAFGDRSRLMFGPVGGGAVQLGPVTDGTLAVAEGIETATAFGLLHGVQTWAALSTSGLLSLALPDRLRRLLIAADSDDSGAGMEAAQALAERARRRCEVAIYPAPAGQDWADVWRATQ